MDPQFVIDRIDAMENNINQRMDTMGTNMKEHLSMCQELCGTRLAHVEIETTKLHQRLNDHKKSIECLCKHKNEELGARRVTKYYMSGVLFIVAILGLFVAFYK